MSDSEQPLENTASSLADWLRDLQETVARRAQTEQAYVEQFAAGSDPQHESLTQKLAEVVDEQARQETALEDRFDQQRRDIEQRLESERHAARTEHEAAVARVRSEAQQQTERVTQQHADSRWVATSVLDDSAEESPKRQFERIRASWDKTRAQQQTQFEALQAEVQQITEARGWSDDPLPPPETNARSLDALSIAFDEALTAAHEQLATFKKLRLPKLFIGMRPAWLLSVLTAAISVVVYLSDPPALLGVSVDRTEPTWVALTAGTALLAATLLLTILYTISSMKLSDLFSQVREQASAAGYFHERWSQLAAAEQRRREGEFTDLQQQREQQLQQQLGRYEAAHHRTLAEVEQRRTSQINALQAEHADRTKALDAERERLLEENQQERQERLAELTRSFDDERNRRQTELDRYTTDRRQRQQQAWDDLAQAWFAGIQAFEAHATQALQHSDEQNLAWTQLADPNWHPPVEIPHDVRIGEYAVDLAEIDGGVPPLEGLAVAANTFRLPAALPFPDCPSLLLECDGQEGRREAVQAIQVALLRMLTRIPPGKLRLTVIDPVGLGESFSGLMHLADYDELLINSRIWTEMGHIEARLAELTEHMENVLQKYLRNEFATIEEYNRFAGEVAEPYHVLVVADFPHKFSEQAARRLVSIATSGPRCGVYLLMSTDRTAQMPNAFDLEAVEATANTFEWRRIPRSQSNPRSQTPVWERTSHAAIPDDPDWEDDLTEVLRIPPATNDQQLDGVFHAKTPELARWPLVIDTPPSPELFTQIIKNVGEASKDIRRVEVSFARVAPQPEDVWSKDSRSGIDVPLGRAGATKLQHLRLGQGTSQHMLVAGKTGSGKSTFFHALITNVALHYSPEEIELYLVDFKKGVEFKAYAPIGQRGTDIRFPNGETVQSPESKVQSPERNDEQRSQFSTLNSQLSPDGSELDGRVSDGLPHARVIAIESDREFGVSVLHRLDAILNERGELFRAVGVQDIAAYRDRLSPVSTVQSRGAPTALDSGLSTLDARRSLPRILLIIDEFQEFFVEDDRYSQQAALVLDRLVRQGRAFGVHVILGSQTLGGAYSLARSTLGQVAVRVALQCSETDAHLILSEENTAARLLTRPGEAIYNDANGLIEGNHPFQIAWLPDEQRNGYLSVIQHFARERDITLPPPVVFEGNIPSDVSRNGELMALIASHGDARSQGSGGRSQGARVIGQESGGEDSFDASFAPSPRTTDHGQRTPRIWLGEAVEIGPPTSITFAPQTGSNLLFVGSDTAAATGILTTALIALAAQLGDNTAASGDTTPSGGRVRSEADGPASGDTAASGGRVRSNADGPASEGSVSSNTDGPAIDARGLPVAQTPPLAEETSARFYVFDGSPAGSPEAELWRQIADIVLGVRLITPQTARQAVDDLAAERRRREDQLGQSYPPLFVFIAGVSKFRDLRKSEDDFTLSSFGAAGEDGPPDPGKQFADLLAGGPEIGIHTLLWSDSYSNVDRWLSRQSLREFELRIAFPMNAADSSNLIDTPAASRLGVHRALLYREETGTSTKFRPYGPPTPNWLHWVHTQLTHHRPLQPATDLEGFHVT